MSENSQAQIYFSDPLVVRYGKEELMTDSKRMDLGDVELGETLASIEESQVIEQQSKQRNDVNIPCPSLEFRLVNRLHDIDEGEIGESVMNICLYHYVEVCSY
jgi:hypothetical protein